jgi:hypothetical protein
VREGVNDGIGEHEKRTRELRHVRDEATKEEHKNGQQAAKKLELSGCVVAEREQANKQHRSSRGYTLRKE